MSIHLKGKSFVWKLVFHWCPFIATVTSTTIYIYSVQAVCTQYMNEMRKGSEILKCFAAQIILFKVDLVSFAQTRFCSVLLVKLSLLLSSVVCCCWFPYNCPIFNIAGMAEALGYFILLFFFILYSQSTVTATTFVISYRHFTFNVESYTPLKLHHKFTTYK